jgi:hypothetical protein
VTCPVCGQNKPMHIHHVTYNPERTIKLCEECCKLLTYRFKKVPKILDEGERNILKQLHNDFEMASRLEKHEIQSLIDELVNLGRTRTIERKIAIVTYIKSQFPGLVIDNYGQSTFIENKPEKKHKCRNCGRPISHNGYCLSCNKNFKNISKNIFDCEE